MIKKVHYCWFGGELPSSVAANVEKWKRLNPDFEFCEWNERNTDVSAYAFGRNAMEQQRWAFVSDIVRLQKLYAEGGIYLDTDVELIRPLNTLAPEEDFMVLGYMYNYSLGTAVLYSPPGHSLVAQILQEYHSIRAGEWPVNNMVFTDYFLNHVPGFILNGRRWKNEESRISVYPKDYFEQPAFVRESGLSIHHFSGSWMPKNKGVPYVVGDSGTSHKVKWLKRKVRTFFPLSLLPYWFVFIKAKVGLSSPIISRWKNSETSK